MGLDRLICDLRDKGVHIPSVLDEHPSFKRERARRSEAPRSFEFPVSREYQTAAAYYGWDDPASGDLASVLSRSSRRQPLPRAARTNAQGRAALPSQTRKARITVGSVIRTLVGAFAK